MVSMRPIDRSSEVESDLVASRMRLTLIEVLGVERGESTHTMEWLRARVVGHIDGSRVGEVFVAVSATGDIVGHTIVRVEHEEGVGEIGLFSTTYVAEEARGRGGGASLLGRGEEWMRENGMTEAVTYTAPWNGKLKDLCVKRSYGFEQVSEEFIRLSRRIAGSV